MIHLFELCYLVLRALLVRVIADVAAGGRDLGPGDDQGGLVGTPSPSSTHGTGLGVAAH